MVNNDSINNLILRTKVVILGSATVGKTTLLKSFQSTSKEISLNYNMTLHAENSVKVVNIPDTHVTVELYCTDVSGNEIFADYAPKYCKGATSYLLVFDTTNPDSFAELTKNLNYLKQVKTLFNCRGILVATKLDKKNQRCITQQEAEEFAKFHSMAYFETSALDPSTADAPFFYLAHNFHERKTMERNLFHFQQDDLEEEQDNFIAYVKNFSVFVIDYSKPMHQIPKQSTCSPFQATISCLINFIENKIKSNSVDSFAVIFTGTKQSKSLCTFRNIYTLINFEKYDIDHILQLQQILAISHDSPNTIQSSSENPLKHLLDSNPLVPDTIGSVDRINIFEALSEANAHFLKLKTKNMKKYVIMVTSNANPSLNDALALSQALQKADDFLGSSISLEIFGINQALVGSTFPFSEFYEKFAFYTHPDDDDQHLFSISANDNYRDLSLLLKAREVNRRTAFRIPLVFGSALSIGVRGFNIVAERKRPSSIKIEARSGLPTTTNSTYFCEKTCKQVNEFIHAFPFGEDKVLFSKEEISEMKGESDSPALTILGFRKQEDLKTKFNILSPTFIIPDESRVIGSNTAFLLLAQSLVKKNMFMLCRLNARKGSAAKFVALVPQLSGYDKMLSQPIPLGFHMVIFPYDDDMRSIDCEVLESEANLVDAAKDIVRMGSEPYVIGEFSNPVIEKQYLMLNALALQKEKMDPFIDEFKSHTGEKAANSIRVFNKLCDADSNNVETTKRKKEGNDQSGSSKRAAKGPTVAQLLKMIGDAGGKVKSRKKADLIEQWSKLNE